MRISCVSKKGHEKWPGEFEELFPLCPYCGFQFKLDTFPIDIDDVIYAVYWTVKCPSCKKEIEGYQDITVKYIVGEKEL